jgi:EAL and modified HD-GYP domain-containing signal transduction protein
MAGPATVAAAPPAEERLVLFARQPILDATGATRGHELLFRRPDGSSGFGENGTRATAHVLVAALTDVGLDEVAGSTPVWVNVTADFLLAVDPLPFPPERVVLEVLEDVRPEPEIVARLAELAAAGYRIALDDFVHAPELEPLLDVASYVKLDLMALGIDGVRAALADLAGRGVELVAEKVETVEERDACLELGIGLFQGYFFERPHLVSGRPVPASTMQKLQSVSALGGTPSFEDVERVVTLDPGLGVRLLRFVNSAAVGARGRVSSIRQALMLLGARTVQQWALLIMLTDVGPVRPALLGTALLRARLCQSLAADARADADAAFAVGLLSCLDALLEQPLDEIVPSLPLTEDVGAALLRREGVLGRLLDEACAMQHGAAAPSERHAAVLRDGLAWTDTTLGELRG